MYIKKKYFIGVLSLVLSNLAYAEILTTEINGYSVDYYVPDISNVVVSKNSQPWIKVLVKDPTPLPKDYKPITNPLLSTFNLSKDSVTSTLSKDAAVVPRFTIDYIPAGSSDIYGESCYDFPLEAKTNFEAAALIWADSLDSNVTITIQACWANFSGSTLGYSGGFSVANTTNIPIANTWYKPALASSFAGFDVRTSSNATYYYDMYITYNDAFDWYYGLDGNPGTKMDLLTVVLHEIAHGLNFSGNMSYDGGTGSYNNYPGVYDRLIVDGSGNSLVDTYANNTLALGSALTSNDLFFNGAIAKAANGGTPAKIYTPATWVDGSSFSHLDYDTYNGTINELMVWAISPGEATHTPDDITLGIFEDVGWNMVPASSNNSTNSAIIMYLLN